LLELPNNLFPDNLFENIISRKISFDLNQETLAEVEIKAHLSDGTTETTTITPIYELNNGEPIKVGLLTIIDSIAPSLIDGFPNDREIYNSIEDVPTMSLNDYENLEETGNITEINDFIFGDPADLSYTDTILEIYQDIEINNVPDVLFRLMFN